MIQENSSDHEYQNIISIMTDVVMTYISNTEMKGGDEHAKSGKISK